MKQSRIIKQALGAKLALDVYVTQSDPRRAAAELLVYIVDKKHTLDLALTKVPEFDALEGSDRGFARAMVSAALRQLGRIDIGITPFLDRPLEEAPPAVRALLRLGAAQMWLMDVADHAAVGETVAAAKRWPDAWHAAGFLNAVLRKVSNNREAFDAAPALAAWPDWLRQRMIQSLGEESASELAAAFADEPQTWLTAKHDADAVAKALESEVHKTGSILAPSGAIDALPGYEAGDWWVQDAAATLPARLLGVSAGDIVLDLCAAPGGKTLQLASTGASVTAVDRSRPRLKRLHENVARTGLGDQITVVDADVEKWQPPAPVSHILLDAPCSALGTLRRHPEGAWIKSPQSIGAFPGVQARFLRAAHTMLSEGGTLVYCVCTPLSEEGIDVVEAILGGGLYTRAPITGAEIPGFEHTLTKPGDLVTLPGGESLHDAFFISRLRKA